MKSKHKSLICGIDPGYSGAIALYNIDTAKIVFVSDMPVFKEKGKNEIDIGVLQFILDMFGASIRCAVIEDVGVMTGKEGRVGMFRFGEGLGVLKGLMGAHYIPVFDVKPAIWKNLEGLSSDKKLSLSKARRLFPEIEAKLTRQKDDGRAEAALLARFGVRFLPLLGPIKDHG